jgi:hypothetical protein
LVQRSLSPCSWPPHACMHIYRAGYEGQNQLSEAVRGGLATILPMPRLICSPTRDKFLWFTFSLRWLWNRERTTWFHAEEMRLLGCYAVCLL